MRNNNIKNIKEEVLELKVLLYLLQQPSKIFPMLWFWSLPHVHKNLSFTVVKYSCCDQNLSFLSSLVMYWSWIDIFEAQSISWLELATFLYLSLETVQSWKASQPWWLELCNPGWQAYLDLRNYAILDGSTTLSLESAQAFLELINYAMHWVNKFHSPWELPNITW